MTFNTKTRQTPTSRNPSFKIHLLLETHTLISAFVLLVSASHNLHLLFMTFNTKTRQTPTWRNPSFKIHLLLEKHTLISAFLVLYSASHKLHRLLTNFRQFKPSYLQPLFRLFTRTQFKTAEKKTDSLTSAIYFKFKQPKSRDYILPTFSKINFSTEKHCTRVILMHLERI